MEFDQNLSAIKLEPVEIKSETSDELLVGITAQSIAEDATKPVEIAGQNVAGGPNFKEESDNDSQERPIPKKPEIPADQGNQSELHAFNDNERLDVNSKLGKSQSESVDLLLLAKIRKMIEEEAIRERERAKCKFNYKDSLITHTNHFHNKNNEKVARRRRGKNHIRKKQPETLNCSECDFTTQTIENLKEHKYRNHWRSYKCSKCPYQTLYQGTLSAHEILHSGTHPNPEEIQYFYCYHCNFRAKWKSNLRVHIRRHFEREEVDFECHICDFKTKKRQIYLCHIGEHNKKQNS